MTEQPEVVEQTPGQLGWLEEPAVPPPHNGTPTSRAAAERVRPTAAVMRQAVYEAICELWPCTDEAVADHLGWDQNSVRPRRIDLVRRGEVVADGKGLTKRGNPAITWRPAPAAPTPERDQ